jgi:hypothetical protein
VKRGHAFTGRVSAFVPWRCGKRAWASIRFDADCGNAQGTADRRTAAARPLAVALPCVSERTPHARELETHALMVGEGAMMGGWKTIRTSVSVTRRSSGAPRGFVRALPSR